MGKNIFLFPGQGSQFVGMGKDLHKDFTVVRHVFEEAEEAIKVNLRKICFDGPESDLRLTENTQPAILVVSFSAFRVMLTETGIRPVLLAGHSLGEYSALVAAEALSLSDAVRAVRERGVAMQKAVPVGKGAMAAFLGAEADVIDRLCQEVTASYSEKDEFVSPANFNGGGQVVVSGTTDAVKKSVELAAEKGIRKAKLLKVSAPFHCKLMQPAADHMAAFFETLTFSEPLDPYIANVDAKIYADEHAMKDCLVRQIPQPVLWEASMNQLKGEGIEQAYEVGPGKVLTGLLRRINKNIGSTPVGTTADIKGLS